MGPGSRRHGAAYGGEAHGESDSQVLTEILKFSREPCPKLEELYTSFCSRRGIEVRTAFDCKVKFWDWRDGPCT